MPRGVQKTIEMQIGEIETRKARFQTKIDAYKAKVADLDAKIKKLEETQKQQKLQSLLKIIEKSGKTPEEVLSALDLKK